MSNNTIFTGIKSRPNVIITYSEKNSSQAEELAKILMREEINVEIADNAVTRLQELCPWGEWHIVIIRDGGLAEPAFDMISDIRRFSDIPLMTVSDNCNEIYKIMALSNGADVCMETENFGRFEFKARVVSQLRRHLAMLPFEDGFISQVNAQTLTNGNITIDKRKREVFSNGVQIKMTAIEYGIMEYLMENCGDVCAIDDIYRRVWRENPYSVKKTVVEHIRRIRSKIEPDPHNPSYIKVVFGVGYKMERAS